jgi:hypothetical protein
MISGDMDKLDVVKFLLKEIEEEQELFKKYEEAVKIAKEQASKDGKDYYWFYIKWEGRHPSKNRIKDNCKKIRQLMLDISKEEK